MDNRTKNLMLMRILDKMKSFDENILITFGVLEPYLKRFCDLEHLPIELREPFWFKRDSKAKTGYVASTNGFVKLIVPDNLVAGFYSQGWRYRILKDIEENYAPLEPIETCVLSAMIDDFPILSVQLYENEKMHQIKDYSALKKLINVNVNTYFYPILLELAKFQKVKSFSQIAFVKSQIKDSPFVIFKIGVLTVQVYDYPVTEFFNSNRLIFSFNK
jgi:hypothetical protein